MTRLRPRLGFCVVMSPLEVGADAAARILEEGLIRLKGLDMELIPADEVISDDRAVSAAVEKFKEKNIDLLCLIEATWSEDYLGTDMLRRLNLPVITWALPGIDTGSLCGCQQLCAVLKELEMDYRFVYGALEEEKVHSDILAYSQAVALKTSLRNTRMGLIGYRIKGMTEVTFDELEMMSVLGPRTIHYGIQELEDRMEKIDADAAGRTWDHVKGIAGKVKIGREQGVASTRTYLALKELVQEDDLSGVAVECYPHLMGQVCLAASLLAEEGVVTACEGDMNSAAAMLMLQRLSGEPVHNTDLLAVYEEDNSMLYSHCGSGGVSIAEDRNSITLAPVRLMDKGCCVLFSGRPGTVTAVNLLGRKGTYRMAVFIGEAVSTDMVFPGNPVRVRFKTPIPRILDTIADEGIGHHWMIGYGDVSRQLEYMCDLTGIRHIEMR